MSRSCLSHTSLSLWVNLCAYLSIFRTPRVLPNAFQRNILKHCWAQHVAYVRPPCCDMLQHVGWFWIKFENDQIFRATFFMLHDVFVVWPLFVFNNTYTNSLKEDPGNYAHAWLLTPLTWCFLRWAKNRIFTLPENFGCNFQISRANFKLNRWTKRCNGHQFFLHFCRLKR